MTLLVCFPCLLLPLPCDLPGGTIILLWYHPKLHHIPHHHFSPTLPLLLLSLSPPGILLTPPIISCPPKHVIERLLHPHEILTHLGISTPLMILPLPIQTLHLLVSCLDLILDPILEMPYGVHLSLKLSPEDDTAFSWRSRSLIASYTPTMDDRISKFLRHWMML